MKITWSRNWNAKTCIVSVRSTWFSASQLIDPTLKFCSIAVKSALLRLTTARFDYTQRTIACTSSDEGRLNESYYGVFTYMIISRSNFHSHNSVELIQFRTRNHERSLTYWLTTYPASLNAHLLDSKEYTPWMPITRDIFHCTCYRPNGKFF